MEEPKESMDVRSVVRAAIEEFVQAERSKVEPAYKAELIEEKRRREELERRMNDLVQENKRSRAIAEEAERNTFVRAELQRLGVSKIDLAYRAVKDDITRSEDGHLVARGPNGHVTAREFLTEFVSENPELLPARMAGGSGMSPAPKSAPATSGIDLDKIRPGMSPEELDRVRQEISRVASQTMRGL